MKPPKPSEKPPVPLQGLHAELQFSRYEGALSKSLEQQTFLAMFGRLCRLFFAAVSMEGTLWWTGVHDRLRCEPKDFTVLFRLSPPIVHERFISMTSLEQPCAPSTRRWGRMDLAHEDEAHMFFFFCSDQMLVGKESQYDV